MNNERIVSKYLACFQIFSSEYGEDTLPLFWFCFCMRGNVRYF